MIDIDRLIVGFDRGLRTLFARPISSRATPGEDLPDESMQAAPRQHAAALMRVNHTGEVCAQALYQGQALTARSRASQAALERAAGEETEHLAWTAQRTVELQDQVVDRDHDGTKFIQPVMMYLCSAGATTP